MANIIKYNKTIICPLCNEEMQFTVCDFDLSLYQHNQEVKTGCILAIRSCFIKDEKENKKY